MAKPQEPLNTERESLATCDFELHQLPPFLRVLLMTDGTVTKSLEAFFWEPITVETLSQSYVIQKADLPRLGVKAGQQALSRKVRLVGSLSELTYAVADSWVKTDCLPQAVRMGLEEGQVGIGELVRELGYETFRRITQISRCEDLSLGLCVGREYVISMAGSPFISIEERFPLRLFEQA